MPKYDPTEYRLYLMNSKDKHILVEGKDDKYLIERLLSDFLSQNNKGQSKKIVVESAESLIKYDNSTQAHGNREKVEFIANSIIGKQYAHNFVGFVDRDLHKFEWDYECSREIQDVLKSHELLERLVFSRGHSIENYIFEFSILCEVLEDNSTTPYANQAINLFKETFEPVLRIACSVGLAATKAQVLSKAKSSIDWQFIEIKSSTEVNFKLDKWIQKLVSDREMKQNQVLDFKSHYTIYTEQVSRASISLVRWICHGHIGYEFLTALYKRCIWDVCPNIQDRDKELSGITWANKKLFHLFINRWIKKMSQEQYEYPIAIFELLGITSE